MTLKAVIFDLDGVLTDTAEFHYQGWQRLADEEGFPFSREKNEQLRGVSRQRSLELILEGRTVERPQFEAMLGRKNRHYMEMLEGITPDHLLPGIPALLDELAAAGILLAVGSASRNARTVLEALHIADRFAIIADGHSVRQAKPAPDLFLFTAQALGLAREACVVVEDAESGIDAALTGGFATLGIGPAERVGRAHLRLDDTSSLTLARLNETLAHANTWRVTEGAWNPATQHHKETVFTIGNGLVASRGVLEEGYPDEWRTTFIHGIFDDMPVSFTEIANVPDWMALEIFFNGRRFRLDEGKLLSFERSLDLRSGLLIRLLRWESHTGERSYLRFERFLSRAQRGLLGLRVQVQPENWAGLVEVRAGLFGHPDNQGLKHWVTLGEGEEQGAIWLRSRTCRSDHILSLASTLARSDGDAERETWLVPGQPTQVLRATLAAGETLTVTKLVALADDRHTSDTFQTALALLNAQQGRPFDEHVKESRASWAAAWHSSDVEVEGDEEAQLALRYNIFQMLAVGPQEDDDVSIGAKSLSGFGYRGHVFWDTELFMLPLFTFTQPEIARHLLLYRYRRLGAARAKARANGFEGAQFPWESAETGEEVTPTWVPHFADRTRLVRIWTGDIEIHITADIAYATMQYWWATGDDGFMRDYGAELILSGARFWESRAEWNAEAERYEFTNVIGPDEYHEHVNNNAFTNGMARWHLLIARSLLPWLDTYAPDRAAQLREQLDLTEARLEQWQTVIDLIHFPLNLETGLIEQFDGYFALKDPKLAEYEPRSRSMHEILGIEGANEAQVIKQPDVLMLLFLLREQMPPEMLRVNWDYYDPRTDHTYGSSLGPAITAIMACELGEPDTGYEHFMRAARADLWDVRGNASDGIHAASAGGLWQAATMGFGGLLVGEQGWTTRARLPRHWRSLRFRFFYRGVLQEMTLLGSDPTNCNSKLPAWEGCYCRTQPYRDGLLHRLWGYLARLDMVRLFYTNSLIVKASQMSLK